MSRCLLIVVLGLACSAAHAELRADYRFQDSLADSLELAPALTPLLPEDGSFAQERIHGIVRTVRRFSAGGGFEVPVAGVLTWDSYSIAMLVKLENPLDYAKLIDTQELTSDPGFYAVNLTLEFYPEAGGPGGRILAERWHQVVVTRAADGTTSGYVDGEQQFTTLDSGGAVEFSAAMVLNLLVDDIDTFGVEVSAGAIARLRLYDEVLDASTVAALDDNQPLFDDGFEEP